MICQAKFAASLLTDLIGFVTVTRHVQKSIILSPPKSIQFEDIYGYLSLSEFLQVQEDMHPVSWHFLSDGSGATPQWPSAAKGGFGGDPDDFRHLHGEKVVPTDMFQVLSQDF